VLTVKEIYSEYGVEGINCDWVPKIVKVINPQKDSANVFGTHNMPTIYDTKNDYGSGTGGARYGSNVP
jgi:hypothetical protein